MRQGKKIGDLQVRGGQSSRLSSMVICLPLFIMEKLTLILMTASKMESMGYFLPVQKKIGNQQNGDPLPVGHGG